MAKLRQYHFDLGNSHTGPVGFCAVIRATSRSKALQVLKQILPDRYDIHIQDYRVSYLEVYFNQEVLLERDIDSVEDASVPE